MIKRYLSAILAIVMVVSMLPTGVLASGNVVENAYPAPTELKWENNNMYWSWYNSSENQGHFRRMFVNLYYSAEEPVGKNGEEYGGWAFSGAQFCDEKSGPLSLSAFNVTEEGWYAFTVAAYGEDTDNNTTYQGIESAMSPAMKYVPADNLPAPTDVKWNGQLLSWTLDMTAEESNVLEHMEVELQYSETADGTYTWQNKYVHWNGVDMDYWKGFAEEDGFYRFRARAISRDWNQCADGAWSEWSDPLEYVVPNKLAAPTSLCWDGLTATWMPSTSDTNLIREYGVQLIYYGVDGTSQPQEVGYCDTQPQENTANFGSEPFDQYGAGHYKFRIRIYSNDIRNAGHSVMVECDKPLIYTPGVDKLPPPANVQWDGLTATWEWDGNADDLSHYSLEVYYAPTKNDKAEHIHSIDADRSWTSDTSWLEEACRTGWYYFTLCAESANADYVASTVVTSDWLEYTAAPALPVPEDLEWDGTNITWTYPDKYADQVKYYQVGLFYYGEDGKGREKNVIIASTEDNTALQYKFSERMFGNDGYYGFKVRAITADAAVASSTEWVECEDLLSYPVTEPTVGTMTAPTDVKWDANWNMTWAWEPGADENYLRKHRVILYYAEEADGEMEEIARFGTEDKVLNRNEWTLYIQDSGYYAFSVQARSDDERFYEDSDPVWSAKTLYELAPRLNAPANPGWNGSVATWTPSEDNNQSVFRGYRVDLYYWGTEEKPLTEGELVDGDRTRDDRYAMESDYFADRGAGRYSFRVCALSRNQDNASNSTWVESDKFVYTGATDQLPEPTGLRWEGTTIKHDVTEDGTVGAYEVRFYNANNSKKSSGEILLPGQFLTIEQEDLDRIGDTVYFKVRAITADANRYKDSEWAVFEQSYPKSLPAPVDLAWDENKNMTWNWKPSDEVAGYLREYRVAICYAATANEEPVEIADFWTEDPYLELGQWSQMVLENGYYAFYVEAHSDDEDHCTSSEPSDMSGTLQYTMPTQRLEAPANAEWDGSVATWEPSASDEEAAFAGYRVDLFYFGTDDPLEEGILVDQSWGFDAKTCLAYYNFAFNRPCGAGNYRFRVYAVSNDPVNWGNSEPVWCDTNFAYAMPQVALAQPDGLYWDGRWATWDVPEDGSVAAYTIEMMDGDGECFLSKEVVAGQFFAVKTWMLEQYSNITFRVKAISANASLASQSAWSEESEPLVYYPELEPPVDPVWQGNTATWTASPDENHEAFYTYELELYYYGTADAPLTEEVKVSRARNDEHKWTFVTEDFAEKGNGLYQFRVRTIADPDMSYSDSEWVESNVFTYTAPTTKLDQPTNLRWEGLTPKWDVIDDGSIAYYEVTICNEDGWCTISTWDVGYFYPLTQKELNAYGDNLTFKVRALSANVNDYGDSDYAECTEASPSMLVEPYVGWTDGTTMSWTWDGRAEYLDEFEVILYYRAEETDEWEQAARHTPNNMMIPMSNWARDLNESGWVRYTLCAKSNAPDVYADSATVYSQPIWFSAMAKLPQPVSAWWDGTMASWNRPNVDNDWVSRYEVQLYYYGATGTEVTHLRANMWAGNDEDNVIFPSDVFSNAGYYGFRVRALTANASMYSNSDWTESGKFLYNGAAATKLATPTGLRWVSHTMVWDVPADADDIAGYEVVYFKPGEESAGQMVTRMTGDFYQLQSWAIDQLGTTIYFKVRALSADLNNYTASEWAYCETTFTEAAARLPDPVLEWDGSNMSWYWPGDPDCLRFFRYNVYYRPSADAAEELILENWGTSGDWLWFGSWGHHAEKTGEYRFRMQAISENENQCASSNEIWSDWKQVEVTANVDVPDYLSWAGNIASWAGPADPNVIEGYQVELYYYGEDGNQPAERRRSNYVWDGAVLQMYDQEIFDNNPGVYRFRVRSLPYDPAVNGGPSAWVWSEFKTFESSTPKLNPPESLKWADNLDMTWAWGGDKDALRNYQISLYYAATETGAKERLVGWGIEELYIKADNWLRFATKDGYYFFSVQAYPDNWNVNMESQEIFSAPLGYTVPNPLEAPAKASWNGSVATWSASPDEDDVREYGIFLYYCGEDGTKAPEYVDNYYASSSQTMTIFHPNTFYRQGHYRFRVFAISGNPPMIGSSPMVESNDFVYTGTPAAKVEAPIKPYWEYTTMKWGVSETAANIAGYQVYAFPAGSENWGSQWTILPGEECRLDRWEIDNFGTNIHFKVRALSADLNQWDNSEWVYCYETFEGLPKMTAPSNVGWDDNWNMVWDWEPEKADKNYLEDFEVVLYYAANQTDEPVEVTNFWPNEEDGNIIYRNNWAQYIVDDGYYSFSVQANSDDENAYDHSEVIESTAILYELPEQRLDAPDSAWWDNSISRWEASEDENFWAFDDYCVVLYYFGKDPDNLTEGEIVNESWGDYSETCVPWKDGNFGREGYYKFRVHTVSRNQTEVGNSEGVWSGLYHYTKPTKTLSDPTGFYWDKVTAKWTVPDDGTVAAYDVRFYNPGKKNMRYVGLLAGEFYTLDQWDIERMGETIYFEVRAIAANASEYESTDWVQYTESTYTLPDPLESPKNLAISKDEMTWTWSGNEDVRGRFEIALYHSANEDGSNAVEVTRFSTSNYRINNWREEVNETGWYFFKVLVNSEDFSVGGNSNWSDMSAGYYYDMPARLPAPTDVKVQGSAVIWTPIGEHQWLDSYRVKLYYTNDKGVTEQIADNWFYFPKDAEQMMAAFESDLYEEEGTYTYTVESTSWDYDQASNSVPVWAVGEFVYTGNPKESLPEPNGVTWDEMTMTWNVNPDVPISHYQVRYYRAGAMEENSNWVTVMPGQYPVLDEWAIDRYGEDIRFQVRAISSNANAYNDSEWVECTGTYTLPAGLDKPTNLRITNDQLIWDWSGNSDLRNDFEVVTYYSATNDSANAVEIDHYYPENPEFNGWREEAEQSGWYFFKVRVRSNNMAVASNSEWSEMSAGYYYEMADRLPAPENVQVNGSTVTWTWDGDRDLLNNFRVRVYFTNENGQTEEIDNDNTPYGYNRTMSHGFLSDLYREHGKGEYKYSVTAVSRDHDQRSNSVMVEASGSFVYNGAPSQSLEITGVKWDGLTMKWDEPTEPVAFYEVRCYPVGPMEYGNYRTLAPGQYPVLDEWEINNYGQDIRFSVRAISGNANVYNDSEWVECTGTYTLPAGLDKPIAPKMNFERIYWTEPGDQVEQPYSVEIYYGGTAQPDANTNWQLVDEFNTSGDSFYGWQSEAEASGWYYFRVRTRSEDITAANHSEWVDSNAYYYTMAPRLAAPTQVSVAGTSLNWKRSVDDDQTNSYQIMLEFKNEDGEWWQTDWARVENEANAEDLSWSLNSETFRNWGLGTYRYQIRATSWDFSYRANSEWVTGPEFQYTGASKSVPAVDNLRWQGYQMVWDEPADTSNIAYYIVDAFNPDNRWNNARREVPVGKNSAYLNLWEMGWLEEPVYFSVIAVPKDANAYNNSIEVRSEKPFGDVLLTDEIDLNPQIDQTTGLLTWNNTDLAEYFEIEVYYVRDKKNGKGKQITTEKCWTNKFQLSSFDYEEYGTGWYTFIINAVQHPGYQGNQKEAVVDFHLTGQKIKLGTPTNLMWNVEYEWWRNNDNGRVYYADKPVVGVMSWERPTNDAGQINDQSRYVIRVYRAGQDEPVLEEHWGFGSTNFSPYLSLDTLLRKNWPSGDYYFTVQAMGDGNLFIDGDESAPSETWTYVNPGVTMPALTGIKWDGRTMTWDMPEDEDSVRGFDARIYYSKTFDGKREEIQGYGVGRHETEYLMDEEVLMDRGNGYYWLEMRAIPYGIDKMTVGGWVAAAEPYNQRAVTEVVNEQLTTTVDTLKDIPETLPEDEEKAAAVIETVETAVADITEKLGTGTLNVEELASAMAADLAAKNEPKPEPGDPTPDPDDPDQPGTDEPEPPAQSTLDMITTLEKAVAVTNAELKAKTEVADDTNLDSVLKATFKEHKVEIVGATLNAAVANNKTAEEADKVTGVELKISAPESGVVLETQSLNAVQFSMNLVDTNAEGEAAKSKFDADPDKPGQQLAVPVQITLPVPDHINPAFLVILHHITGTREYEEIRPHMEEKDGVWYASFVVDSFSDFVFDCVIDIDAQYDINADKVEVNTNFSAPLDGIIMLAAYNEAGRQMGLYQLQDDKDMTAGSHTMVIPCEAAESVTTVKLFQLGNLSDCIPVDVETKCDVN